MNRTKKYTIIFITVCLVGILGTGIYNGVSDNPNQNKQVEEQIPVQDQTKEENESEVKENNSSSTEKQSQEVEEKKEVSKKEETTTQQTQETVKQPIKEETKPAIVEEKTITVSVTVSGLDQFEYKGTPSLKENSSAYDAVKFICDVNNAKITGSSSYIEGVNSLFAGDYPGLSGWVYEVNGVSPMTSIGSYKLKDQDYVKFYYTK